MWTFSRLLSAWKSAELSLCVAGGGALIYKAIVSQYGGTQAEPQTPKFFSDNDTSTDDAYEGQCLHRQLYQPCVPYPNWDYNWDGRMRDDSTLEYLSTEQGLKRSKSAGKTRHLLLIRHGQYDETSKDDDERHLTPLGRRQAELTGRRLSSLAAGGLRGAETRFTRPCSFKAIHQSDMTRAKETAAIIASYLP
jgi:serine/threonine-protein phosphatase PGAM5